MTQGLVTELARSFTARSMALRLEQRGSEVKITEEVVRAAAGNTQSGKEILALLLEERGDEVKTIEKVVEAATGKC
jgi:hypothetical protein